MARGSRDRAGARSRRGHLGRPQPLRRAGHRGPATEHGDNASAERPRDVDGQLVEIPQAHGLTQPQAPRITYPFRVPAGEIFVLGDNRQASSDSRTFGSVPIQNIIGKVVLRFWPADRLTFFEW